MPVVRDIAMAATRVAERTVDGVRHATRTQATHRGDAPFRREDRRL
jgi:hypothetical protein